MYSRHQLGIPPTDIHHELTIVYGDDVPTLRTVFNWVVLIKTGKFELKKRVSSGRPVSAVTLANIERIRDLIKTDCRMSCSDIADELEIPKTCVYRVLTSVLELRNVFSQWVPHKLNDSNKAARVQCCKALIELFQEKGLEYMLSHYCVEDETWVNWDIEVNRRVWIGKKTPKPTKLKPKLTKRKTLAFVAFTSKPRRYSVSVLPQGHTVNAELIIQYLKDTNHRFLNLRQSKIKLSELILQMDNAKPHAAVVTQQYLADRGVSLVKQSPYSPDLNMCDRYIFREIKNDLRCEFYDGPEAVQKAVLRSLRLIPETKLKDQILKLVAHCEASGDYISDI